MVGIRWLALATLLAAACAGCTSAAARHAAVPVQPSAASSSGGAPAGTTPATRTNPPSSSAPATRPPAPHSTPSGVPPVSAQARAAGLVDVRTVVPDAVVDLRYATSDNFVHVPLYPANARCLVHESMSPGLRTAAARLRRLGDVLVFWDCYRPHAVQVRMFQIVPDPSWVARPSSSARSHEAGRSVDVTLAAAATGQPCATGQRVDGHCLLDLGTGFDDFTPRAHAYATAGVSTRAQANRATLRSAMNAGGIAVYAGEWWHFDGPGALVGRPLLNAPVY